MDEEGDTGLTLKPVQVVTSIRNVSPHQDGCWSWLVCFAAVVSNVVICGFTFSYGILFPAILDEFQQGKARSGKFLYLHIYVVDNELGYEEGHSI